MQLDLAHIAIATGGTLVTAARMKKTTSKNGIVQHHSTFGVKKPKGALPGKSAGGWLKKNGKKVIIPDTRNSGALEKFADKLKGHFERTTDLDWVYTYKKTSGFVRATASTDYVTFDVRSPVFPSGSSFNTKYFETQKVTVKQVQAFVEFVQALGKIEMPKVPAFLAK